LHAQETRKALAGPLAFFNGIRRPAVRRDLAQAKKDLATHSKHLCHLLLAALDATVGHSLDRSVQLAINPIVDLV
jgi:hypothetical protein